MSLICCLSSFRPRPQRLMFLRTINTILTHCPRFPDAIILGRLARAILPSCTSILSRKAETSPQDGAGASSKSRKGKKRARGYEGDEVFKVGKTSLYATPEEGQSTLMAVSGKSQTPCLNTEGAQYFEWQPWACCSITPIFLPKCNLLRCACYCRYYWNSRTCRPRQSPQMRPCTGLSAATCTISVDNKRPAGLGHWAEHWA